MKDPADDIVDLYERHAHEWASDRGRTRFIERPWLQRFVALLPKGAAVLDIGCGAGFPIASFLRETGFAVTGVDSSPTMVALCRERYPDQEWLVADMRLLRLNRSFDGIVAWDSTFHLSPADQRQMFPIFRDHTAAQAPLLFTSGPGGPGEAIGAFRGDPLYHASLSPQEYRSLLTANHFSVQHHIREDPDCGRHTVWLARRDQDG